MVVLDDQGDGMSSRRCHPVLVVPGSAFKGFRFPPEIIVLAVRWYLRYGLSYRDLEELLAERGVEVDQRDRLPVGAVLHTAPRRRGPALSPRGW